MGKKKKKNKKYKMPPPGPVKAISSINILRVNVMRVCIVILTVIIMFFCAFAGVAILSLDESVDNIENTTTILSKMLNDTDNSVKRVGKKLDKSWLLSW